MGNDSVDTWVPAFACLVWVLILVWWFWDYVAAVLRRQPGESLWDALSRASSERQLDKAAREQMFGSRFATGMASLLCVLLSLVLLSTLTRGGPIGIALLCYVVVGLVVLRRYDLRGHASWQRLTFGNRLWFRLTHAWLWPLHLVFRRTRPDGENTTTDTTDRKES